MNRILRIRSEINELYHDATIKIGKNVEFSDEDKFAAFYTSKFLIQDTGEAVWSHMEKDFS